MPETPAVVARRIVRVLNKFLKSIDQEGADHVIRSDIFVPIFAEVIGKRQHEGSPIEDIPSLFTGTTIYLYDRIKAETDANTGLATVLSLVLTNLNEVSAYLLHQPEDIRKRYGELDPFKQKKMQHLNSYHLGTFGDEPK